MSRRSHGDVQPGIRWGPFTLRVPFVHARAEWPELIQGLLVAGATGLAIVPLYEGHFGMTFEMAIAVCVVQGLILCSSPIVFGEPFCPGWLTPALPLVLLELAQYPTVDERISFVTALVLSVAGIFLFFGITRLGPVFVRWVPPVLKSGIILGAGFSAIYGEFIAHGDRQPHLDEYRYSILIAVGITLLLLFSLPLEGLKKRFRWLAAIAGLGLAPGFIIAMVAGPWVGEVDYAGFRALFVDPSTGAWRFGWGDIIFVPDFAGMWNGYSPLGNAGFPDWTHFREALPLAFAAYIIGFGDIVTGTAILQSAAVERGDERIPFDERRTHLSIGIRNFTQAMVMGPFFPLQGPLWTGAMVVVAERYRAGRQAMESIYSGIFSYYVFGLPLLFFCKPFIEIFRPVLAVSLSLTLIVTGFACSYVALAIPRDRVERGLAVVMALTIMYYSTTVGLVVGVCLTVCLLGRAAWRREEEAISTPPADQDEQR